MKQAPHEHLAATVSGILDYADEFLTAEQSAALHLGTALGALKRLPLKTLEQLAELAAQMARTPSDTSTLSPKP